MEAAADRPGEGRIRPGPHPFRFLQPRESDRRAHAAAITTKLGFLVAHRPGVHPAHPCCEAARHPGPAGQGPVAVHIITGGADEEMARDGDNSDTRTTATPAPTSTMTVLRRRVDVAPAFRSLRALLQRARQAFSVGPAEITLPVFFGGSSDEAIEVAGKHADVCAFWGEALRRVRENGRRECRTSAARHGRHVGVKPVPLRPGPRRHGGGRVEARRAGTRSSSASAKLRETSGRADQRTRSRQTSGHSASCRRRPLAIASTSVSGPGSPASAGARGNSTGLVGTAEQVARRAHRLLRSQGSTA